MKCFLSGDTFREVGSESRVRFKFIREEGVIFNITSCVPGIVLGATGEYWGIVGYTTEKKNNREGFLPPRRWH